MAKTGRKKYRLLKYLLLLSCVSCSHVPQDLASSITYEPQAHDFIRLQNSFVPLTSDDLVTDWGKEWNIARAFVADFDLYRAITSYRRAEILIGDRFLEHKRAIQYELVFCYYLGGRTKEAVLSFERSELLNTDKAFPDYQNLLLVLYECYRAQGNQERQERVQDLLAQSFPATERALELGQAIAHADWGKMVACREDAAAPSLDQLICRYAEEKKSVSMAQFLNAVCPGAGYWYVGQTKSAVTALVLNGLFLGASYQFFQQGYPAAGLIAASFEAGWYFGGIYGAGEEALVYNERIYEVRASQLMQEQKLFPLLMIRKSF